MPVTSMRRTHSFTMLSTMLLKMTREKGHALGDTVFDAEGTVVISEGVTNEDGFIPKGADKAERLRT